MIDVADEDLLPRMSMLLSPKSTHFEPESPELKKPVSVSLSKETVRSLLAKQNVRNI